MKVVSTPLGPQLDAGRGAARVAAHASAWQKNVGKSRCLIAADNRVLQLLEPLAATDVVTVDEFTHGVERAAAKWRFCASAKTPPR